MKLAEQIAGSCAELREFRRDLHAHPELKFEEFRTADLIATRLSGWGIPVHRGLGGTGVVGIVKAGNSNRAIGLRADMDALPMTEFNRFAHASQHPGRMHACGHDGHVAMLLAAAKHFSTERHFDGTVYLHLPAGRGGRRRRARDDPTTACSRSSRWKRCSACTTGPACRSGSSR